LAISDGCSLGYRYDSVRTPAEQNTHWQYLMDVVWATDMTPCGQLLKKYLLPISDGCSLGYRYDSIRTPAEQNTHWQYVMDVVWVIDMNPLYNLLNKILICNFWSM
jgi:hypothetical protein